MESVELSKDALSILNRLVSLRYNVKDNDFNFQTYRSEYIEELLKQNLDYLLTHSGKKLYSLKEIKEKLTPVFKKYGVERGYIFGSYAVGRANKNSDIDIRIDPGDIKGLLKLSCLKSDLEDVLGIDIDLITTGGTETDFLDMIKGEEILIYERKR